MVDDPLTHLCCYLVLEQLLNLSSYLEGDLTEGSAGGWGILIQSLQDDVGEG